MLPMSWLLYFQINGNHFKSNQPLHILVDPVLFFVNVTVTWVKNSGDDAVFEECFAIGFMNQSANHKNS